MMDGFVRVAAITPKVQVADPAANAEEMVQWIARAKAEKASLVVFPELALSGATCGDLFFQTTLHRKVEQGLQYLAAQARDIGVVVGAPLCVRGKLYNCAVLLADGKMCAAVPKRDLNHEELRYFYPGQEEACTVTFGEGLIRFGANLVWQGGGHGDYLLGIEVGDELWRPAPRSYELAQKGGVLIVNPFAMPSGVGTAEYHRQLVQTQAGRLRCCYVSVGAGMGESTTNAVYAGQRLIAEDGEIIAEGALHSEGMTLADVDLERCLYGRRQSAYFKERYQSEEEEPAQSAAFFCIKEIELKRTFSRMPFVPQEESERVARCRRILQMQSIALSKRVEHAHCRSLVIGVSGGLDSTLALLVACEAMDRLKRKRSDIIGVTMPCFGTTKRTKGNAETLCECLGVTLRCVDIQAAVHQHFTDIGQDPQKTDVTYENAQARERTQVLMDMANMEGGMVVGTGDLSELALGWATYNGDHMSMYAVNASLPKTLIRHVVQVYAEQCGNAELRRVLLDILATPVSPELLPAQNGEIAQKTEELVGPYELHDFILFYVLRYGYAPAKIYRMAQTAFRGEYDEATILKWMKSFYRRFFQQQYKRSCMPDGPRIGSVSLSPRGDFSMPSDACAAAWLAETEALAEGGLKA